MSVRTDTVNLNININGNKAQNDLNNLRKKAADIKFEMQGLTKGTADYIAKGKELAQVTAAADALKKQIGITSLTQKELLKELGKLKALYGSTIPMSNEYKELGKQIKIVEDRLYEVKNGVTGFAKFFSKIKDEVKQFGIVAAGYLGFQFLTSQFSNIIRGAGKMSDQLADLQRVAGLTADEARNLNNQFKELNTRTSTEGLRDIAIVAGKLGVAKDDIYDFTAAVDQLVVVLGDELGNADQITTQLGKILNVFNGEINAEGITHLGNAFVELANTGSATGVFIADFDQRLSGLAKSAGIGLGQLSGLGAGLEEMGARVESASTAIQKIIFSISKDLPAAAKVANLSAKELSAEGVKSFEELFGKKPEVALLKYSQALIKNKGAFADIVASLTDSGEENTRVVATILQMGNGYDKLRGRVDLGAESIKRAGSVTEGFALKNETFGATLDKLGKEFNRLVTSPGVTNFLKGAVEGALSFIKVIRAIPAFIKENSGAVTLLLYGIILLNGAYIKSAAAAIYDGTAKLFSTGATKASAIASNLAVVAQAAYITVTNLLAGRITLATAAQRLWNIATLGSTAGLGIVLIAVGALAAIFSSLAGSLSKATTMSKLYAEVQKKVVESTTEELSKIQILTDVLKDGNTSYENKEKALKALIAISPQYLSGLTLENIKTSEGVALLKKYTDSLLLKAELEAKSSLLTDKLKDRNSTRATIRTNPLLAKSNDDDIDKFVDKGLAGKLKGTDLFNYLQLKLDGVDFDKFKQNTKEITILQTDLTTQAKKNVESVVGAATSTDTVTTTTANTIKSLKEQLKALDDAYENIDINNKKALKSNRDSAAAIQAQLDALQGKKSPGQKHDDSEFKRLKAEAEKFYKEIKELKKRIDKGDSPEEQEIQRATQKYEALLLKAKEYYFKHAIDKKRFGEEEKIIEDEKQRELLEIFEKYFKKRQEEGASKEYDDSLTARREFSDQLKIAAAKDYANGKITKKQHEAELKQIERDETHDRVIIATDYAATVKKAQTDLKAFRKINEEQTTADIIAENEKRSSDNAKDKLTKAKRKVLTSRPDTQARLDAQKELLKIEYEQEIANADFTHEELLTKEAEYQENIKTLDQEFMQARITQVQTYVGYVIQAMNSLNTILNNRENAQFNKEKTQFNKRRKEYKNQLDNKLISQAQYDKKMNELQEEQDKKERELKRKQAKREKAINLFRAIVNTAAGVASSLSYGGPVGIALAAITAVLGALEIAAIASQPLPEAGKGKWFTQGDKHSDASGGIPILIERDEAVIKADAMTDNQEYSVRGTPRQITGALNAQAGGPNWAGGAIVKKMSSITNRPAQLNPGLVVKMADGGNLKDRDATGGNNTGAETNTLLRQLLQETKENTSEIKTMKTKLHAIVSIKEYREQEKLFDASQKFSGLG